MAEAPNKAGIGSQAERIESCPGYETLRAWRAGELPEDQANRVIAHLVECEDCREWSMLSEEETFTPPPPESLWGGAIAVIVFGPLQRKMPGLARLRAELEEDGAQLSGPTDQKSWAAMEVGTGRLTAEPVEIEQLSALVKRLRREIQPGAAFGAVVAAGYGALGDGDRGPYGPVLEEALLLEKYLVAGEVRLSSHVHALLQEVPGVRSERVGAGAIYALQRSPSTRLPLPGRPGVHVVQTARTRQLSALNMAIRPQPVIRQRIERDVPRRLPPGLPQLIKGDCVAIELEAPESGWAYALLQRGKDLDLPYEALPVIADGKRVAGREVLEIVLDEREGLERPVLLVSAEPLPFLEEAVKAANRVPAASADDRLVVLSDLLSETYGRDDFALVEAGAIEHVRVESNDPPELAEALKAAREEQHARAEVLLRDFLSRPTSSELQVKAEIQLGAALRLQGRPDEAIEHLERAEHIAFRTGDIASGAAAVCFIGRALLDVEKFELALACFDRAAAAHRSVGDRVGEATDQMFRASVLWKQNHLPEAGEAYRKVIEPARQARELRLLGASLEGMGTIYHELGALDLAGTYMARAHATFVEADYLAGQMRVQGNMGMLALETRDFEAAREHFERQLELAIQVGSIPQRGAALNNLAWACKNLGFRDEARQLLHEALALFQNALFSHRCVTLLYLGEIAIESGSLDEAADLLLQVPRDPQLPVELRWRAALSRGRLGDLRADPNAEAEYLEGVQIIESARERLPRELRKEFLDISVALFDGWIGHLLSRQAPVEALLNAVERSRARAFAEALEALEAREGWQELKQEASGEDGMTAGWASHASLKAMLPPDAVIIESYSLPEQLVLFRVGAERVEYRALPLGRELLARLCKAALDYCREPGGLEETTLPPLGALSDALLAPIADWLDALKEDEALGFVAHGALHGVPVHALPRPGHGDEPLIRTHPVYYLPSLEATGRWLKRRSTPATGMLAFAASREELPCAAQEAQNACEAMGGGRVFIGAQATRSVLERLAPEARYLHLSLHARQGRGAKHASLFLPGPGVGEPASASDAWAADPPDHPGSDAVGAGWISRLALSAELVVLSACEAGAGTMSPAGEGHDLLSWAFLSAGARSVVASAWKVDDAATCALMKRFYRHLAAGASRIDSLARAQRDYLAAANGAPGWKSPVDNPASAVTAAQAHPYYWAGFFLTGDWR